MKTQNAFREVTRTVTKSCEDCGRPIAGSTRKFHYDNSDLALSFKQIMAISDKEDVEPFLNEREKCARCKRRSK